MNTTAIILSLLCALFGIAAVVWWRFASTEETRRLRLRVALVLFGSAVIICCVDLVAGFLQILVTLFGIGWLARLLVFQAGVGASRTHRERELVNSGDLRK